MSHLGLVYAAAALAKGCRVCCFDDDRDLIARLRSLDLPIHEPGILEVMAANKSRIKFTADWSDLVGLDLVFLALDVATDDAGVKDLSALDHLTESLRSRVGNEAKIVLLSQVPPGYSRDKFQRGLIDYYQVETLVFGEALDRASNPERFIVGTPNEKALDPVLVDFLSQWECPTYTMLFESAELAKISINIFLAASVTATNTLASLCERNGADWASIRPAVSADKRIGPYAYLKPGLGISGGNIERDIRSLSDDLRGFGLDSSFVDAIATHSRYRKDWLIEKVAVAFKEGYLGKVGVLGLTYKPDTLSLKNSPSIRLLMAFPERNFVVYDPMAKATGLENVEEARDVDEVFMVCDVVVVATPWPVFREFDWQSVFGSKLQTKHIIDPFGVCPRELVSRAGMGSKYCQLGARNG